MSENSSSHWFWRYGYMVIIPVIILTVWFSKGSDRENQNNVNPAVFVYFKTVKQECLDVPFNEQTDQCVKIDLYHKDCRLVSSRCSSLSFYQLLKQLKFDVPEYYQEGFIAK